MADGRLYMIIFMENADYLNAAKRRGFRSGVTLSNS
jgi:hypothetical protein